MKWIVYMGICGSLLAVLVSCGGGGSGTPAAGGYVQLNAAAMANAAAGEFVTSAPNSALPADVTCAAKINAAKKLENRPDNAVYNATLGKALPNFFNGSLPHANSVIAAHISGNFTGSTEDILRWGACKWGLDENVVKAMAANESQWQQAHRFNATNLAAAQAAASAVGNTLTYHPSTNCATNTMPGSSVPPTPLPNPLPVAQPQGTGAASANCSRDWGILQVNYEQYPSAWPQAESSTAMNVDVVLAIVRACYDGDESWLATKSLPAGAKPYAAGNLSYCVGRYFSGSWYDANAQLYINRINVELNGKTWAQPAFQNKNWVYP